MNPAAPRMIADESAEVQPGIEQAERCTQEQREPLDPHDPVDGPGRGVACPVETASEPFGGTRWGQPYGHASGQVEGRAHESFLRRQLVAGDGLSPDLYLVLALLPGGGIGFGDVKLAGLLGMLLGWHSWTHVLQGTMATFLIGGVVAVALLALRRKGARDDFAYGPPMLVGAAGAIIVPPLLALL